MEAEEWRKQRKGGREAGGGREEAEKGGSKEGKEGEELRKKAKEVREGWKDGEEARLGGNGGRKGGKEGKEGSEEGREEAGRKEGMRQERKGSKPGKGARKEGGLVLCSLVPISSSLSSSAARHDAARPHPSHPLPPVSDAPGQAHRLRLQGALPPAGKGAPSHAMETWKSPGLEKIPKVLEKSWTLLLIILYFI